MFNILLVKSQIEMRDKLFITEGKAILINWQRTYLNCVLLSNK